MSGLAIYFPQTPAFKRMPSSPSPSEWPSKRRKLTPITGDVRSPIKTNWHAVYLQPNSSHNPTSPPSPTEFVTPPDSCELPDSSPSPSPSRSSWVATTTSSSLSENQDSDGSTIFSGSCFDLVPTIMSFPVPPFQEGSTPSPALSISSNSRASSEPCTPVKVPCLPTCVCRLDLPMDTFGKRSDIERVQLSQKTAPTHNGREVSRMLVPRSTWGLFKTTTSESVQSEATMYVYRGTNKRGHTITVGNEDLWMDERNPFLLTPFDLRQDRLEYFSGRIIPTTSSLSLL